MNDEERIEKIIEFIEEYNIPIESFSDKKGRTRYYLDKLLFETPNQNGGIPCILYRYYNGRHTIRRCGSKLMFLIDGEDGPRVVWDPRRALDEYDDLEGLNGYIQYRYDEPVVDDDDDVGGDGDGDDDDDDNGDDNGDDDKKTDWYEVLLVNKDATVDEIRTAYRRRCNQNHPDKIEHMSDEMKKFANEMMQKITAAYDTARRLRGF